MEQERRPLNFGDLLHAIEIGALLLASAGFYYHTQAAIDLTTADHAILQRMDRYFCQNDHKYCDYMDRSGGR